MKNLNKGEKKFVMTLGLIVIAGAVFVIGFSLWNGGGFPIIAALLIIIGLMAVFLAKR